MSATQDPKGSKTNDKTSTKPAPKEAKPAANKLEEDDEFEDFPVEGDLPSDSVDGPTGMALIILYQIGPKKKPKFQVETITCGRKAGMMTIPLMISHSN
jgi:hypothetical protein